MSTPSNTLGSAPYKNKSPLTPEIVAKSSQSLDNHVKTITNALKHFNDVIYKNKLDMLPGNGTIILDTTASMFSVIQAYKLNENNTSILSATKQAYKSLGKLIKFCDQIMLCVDAEECASILSGNNVQEMVDSLEEAVRNLVTLAQQRLQEKENLGFQFDITAGKQQPPTRSTATTGTKNTHNLLLSPPVEFPGRSTSTSNITLTSKERDILERTTSDPMHVSYSTDNIRRDSSVPPKQQLLNRSRSDTPPPPLPPKRKSQPNASNINFDTSMNSDRKNAIGGVGHQMVRPCSTYENVSECSLNYYREDEEERHELNLICKNIMDGGAKTSNEESDENNIGKCDTDTLSDGDSESEIDEEFNDTELRKVNSICTSSSRTSSNSETSCVSTSNDDECRIFTPNQLETEDPDLLPLALPRRRQILTNLTSNDSDATDNNTEIIKNTKLRRRGRIFEWQTKHQSLYQSNFEMTPGQEPPPSPMKKKHILAYMEIWKSSASAPIAKRHTIHIAQSQSMNIAAEFAEELREITPTIPAKDYMTSSFRPTPPPKPNSLTSNHSLLSISGSVDNEIMYILPEEMRDQCVEDDTSIIHSKNDYDTSSPYTSNYPTLNKMKPDSHCASVVEEIVNYNNYNRKSPSSMEEIDYFPNLLEELDITPYLQFKKENEEGPDVKGGYIDALIVHASSVQKATDQGFSEAFITTFRTFIQPIDLIGKLIRRYTVFFGELNEQKQKAAKETFSLLVRVVNDLTCFDLNSPNLLTLLVEFVYELVCAGQLYLAKLLRNKIVEKVTLYKESRLPAQPTKDMFTIATVQPSLLHFKSTDLAEQMTLLDAELFQKIEIPEVLIFAKDQCEEMSPNLYKFTEHFNNMSYWVKSKILTLNSAKDREKYVEKFIRIMSHLKKIHNYNSYLAVLSALDSAPIRRLKWKNSIKEALEQNCDIIDSSSSFRNYRKALEGTLPPCIPYIGLVLTDLTFVHEGNPDNLWDGSVNFSKRWQQFKLLVNMERFKKFPYTYERNEDIIKFFENFENFLGEEQLWHLSETIKPKGRRVANS